MAKQLKCSNCEGSTQITESRHIGGNIYRRYKCVKCGFVFYTKESISDEAWEEIKRYHREYYRARKGSEGSK
jgi:transcriptional regulator NrdR family protein